MGTPIAKAAHWIHLTMKHDAPQQMTVVPLCWICLGDESETVECLRRDCSCRGTDAGYVHQSCLVKYAEEKSEEMASRDPDNQDHYLFREPWEVCPNCHQDYQNDLAVDVSAKFVSFVQRKHPHDQPKLVDALNLRLWLLVSMINSSEQTLRITEAKAIALQVLALIHQMKAETPNLPTRCMQCEALTYNDLGLIALNEESEESAREAVLHFEKYLTLSKSIDFNVGIANAEYNIAYAKSKYHETSDIFKQEEEQLKKAQDLYELRVAKHGEGDTLALHEGINLAMSLWRTNRASEAERMLSRLATVSKQIHGSQHKLTKKIEAELHDLKHETNS